MRFDTERKQFVAYLRGISGTWITYSPDREWMAYISHPEGKLWRARADGSGKQQLTFGPFSDDGAAWSPAGRWIAFRSLMGGPVYRIYLVPAEGGEPRPIPWTRTEQGLPTWSPDGKRIAFGDVPHRYGIPDGGERLHIYDLEHDTVSHVPGSEGLWSSRWSPDGHSLAATTIQGQQLRLYDFAASTWRAFEADSIDHLTWSLDSKFVHYHTSGNQYRLRRLRIADGTVEELADLSGHTMAAYWWSSITAEGDPIVLRGLIATEVYVLQLDES